MDDGALRKVETNKAVYRSNRFVAGTMCQWKGRSRRYHGRNCQELGNDFRGIRRSRSKGPPREPVARVAAAVQFRKAAGDDRGLQGEEKPAFPRHYPENSAGIPANSADRRALG